MGHIVNYIVYRKYNGPNKFEVEILVLRSPEVCTYVCQVCVDIAGTLGMSTNSKLLIIHWTKITTVNIAFEKTS